MVETVLAAALIGLASGAVYALIAVGLSLGFRSGGLINVAQGDLAVLAAYVGAALIGAGLSYWAAIVIVSIGAGVVMLGLDRLVFRALYGCNPVYLIIITVGISAIIEAAITWHWGGNPLVYKPALGSGVLRVGGLHLFVEDLVALGICLAVAGVLGAALRYTSIGRSVRAGASDAVAAELCGISVARARAISLAASGVLAGLGGMILAALVSLYPTTGLDITLAAFVGAVIGGFGSVWGAVLGSLIVGLVEGVAGAYVASDFHSVFVYLLLGLILIVRPAGLFGEEGVGVREV
jgi:branched-chain amino acid transport system permease protein